MQPQPLALAPKFEDLEKKPDQTREQMIAMFIGTLQAGADARVSRRNGYETGWMDDLRQFHGEYDAKTSAELRAAKGKSQVFVNITRSKVNTLAARLGDMLFPTDDRNWGIQSTPVPTLVEGAQKAIDQVVNAAEQANQALALGDAAGAQQIVDAAGPAELLAQQVKAELDEAISRAQKMEKLIEDQLVECEYGVHCRKAIMQACQLGTGVMKGPFRSNRSKMRWSTRLNEQQQPERVLVRTTDTAPAYRWVDLWSWFPDMDTPDHRYGNGTYERHLMTEKQVRDLQFEDGFNKDGLREVLKAGPTKDAPQYLTDLRNINGGENVISYDGSKLYTVWEYTGPITAREMRELAAYSGEADVAKEYEEVDELRAVYVIVWFCNGHLLKFAEYPLDSGDVLYSAFRLEKDETSPFGVGIPRLMRHSQRALNGAWRMMMDNSGLSVGPQIFIDTNYIEPADGSWDVTSRKVWLLKKPIDPGAKAFDTFNINSNQTELSNIIELSMRFVDEETGITVLASGDQGTHTTQTAQGMTILMNSVNVIFRRIVKCWDDEMTVPNIRRLYDWNMQFSPDDSVKGDFNVDARGSSVLLVREVMAQSLMQWVMNLSQSPTIGRLLKLAPLVRKAAQAQLINADEVIKSDDEIARDDAAARANPPPDYEMEKIKSAERIAMAANEAKMQLASVQRETAMMQLAAAQNMKLEDIKSKLAIVQMKIDSDERQLAVEVGMQERTGESAGGRV